MIEKVTLEKLLMSTSQEQPSEKKEQSSREKKDKKALESLSKLMIEKKACEFLKFIKHSKYSVIEQLNKMLVRISLLSLF